MDNRILPLSTRIPRRTTPRRSHRTGQIGRLTGSTVHVLHVARGHIVPEDISVGSGLGVWSAADDAESSDHAALQRLVDSLAAAGIDSHGEMASATEHDTADLILQRAKDLDVDLPVLGHQHHRGSRTAERVIHHAPPYSVLLARAPDVS